MNLSHFDGARSIVVSISRCGRDDLCSNHGGHKHFLYLKKKTKGSCFNSRTTFAKTSLVKQRLKQANAYTTAANSQAVIFFFLVLLPPHSHSHPPAIDLDGDDLDGDWTGPLPALALRV